MKVYIVKRGKMYLSRTFAWTRAQRNAFRFMGRSARWFASDNARWFGKPARVVRLTPRKATT